MACTLDKVNHDRGHGGLPALSYQEASRALIRCPRGMQPFEFLVGYRPSETEPVLPLEVDVDRELA